MGERESNQERELHKEKASPRNRVVFHRERGRDEKKMRKREEEKEKKERGSATLLAMEIPLQERERMVCLDGKFHHEREKFGRNEERMRHESGVTGGGGG